MCSVRELIWALYPTVVLKKATKSTHSCFVFFWLKEFTPYNYGTVTEITVTLHSLILILKEMPNGQENNSEKNSKDFFLEKNNALRRK